MKVKSLLTCLCVFTLFTLGTHALADTPDYSASLKAGDVAKIDAQDLSPTQFAVGYREVEFKAHKIKKMDHDELKDFLKEKPVPVIIGPGGKAYLIDHHHLARAVIDAGNPHKMYCKIEANWSKLDVQKFWSQMIAKNWAYLIDENGEGPRPTSALPPTVKGLKDDPYRSLAWAVREAGGYLKNTTPFSEFKWAEFFRSRIKLDINCSDKEFDSATKSALRLAQSPAASKLPGYKGNVNSFFNPFKALPNLN